MSKQRHYQPQRTGKIIIGGPLLRAKESWTYPLSGGFRFPVWQVVEAVLPGTVCHYLLCPALCVSQGHLLEDGIFSVVVAWCSLSTVTIQLKKKCIWCSVGLWSSLFSWDERHWTCLLHCPAIAYTNRMSCLSVYIPLVDLRSSRKSVQHQASCLKLF